jgi:hypothetical protein
VEGAWVAPREGRVGVAGVFEAITTSVRGAMLQFAAVVALFQAALLVVVIATFSGAVFGWRGTGRRGQSGSSARWGPL